MRKSRFSIFALQQRMSRPGSTAVFAVFLVGYLLYLCILLGINTREGWYSSFQWSRTGQQYDKSFQSYEQEVTYSHTYAYTFAYFFKGDDYINAGNVPFLDTTPYLIPSELVFPISLVSMVFALTLARFKVRKGGATLRRLSLPGRSIYIMQWLSDLVHTLCVWLLHLAVIFLFYTAYMRFAPAELTYPQNLYMLFASERYLYMLFPVLNPISLARMLPLVVAVSLLPSLISSAFESIYDSVADSHLPSLGSSVFESIFGVDSNMGALVLVGVSVGVTCWGYFSSDRTWSPVICLFAMAVVVSTNFYRIRKLRKGEKFNG